MKTQALLFILLLIGLAGLNSCIDDPVETEKETYTVEGRLYKGLGDEPWPNAQLELTAWDRGNITQGDKHYQLASGTTDANGYFKLEYEQFTTSERDIELEGVYLEANGHDVMRAFPWNDDIEKDIAEIDHSRVFVKAVLPDSIDSLYIELPFSRDSPFSLVV